MIDSLRKYSRTVRGSLELSSESLINLSSLNENFLPGENSTAIHYLRVQRTNGAFPSILYRTRETDPCDVGGQGGRHGGGGGGGGDNGAGWGSRFTETVRIMERKGMER